MSRRAPLWVVAVIVAAMLPVFATPELIARCPAGNEAFLTMLRLYPAYVVLTGWLAWLSWRERPYITWILLAMMILTHIGAWALVCMP